MFLIFSAITNPSQQAGWGKSGSKLHALQSFAPYAMSDAAGAELRSAPAPDPFSVLTAQAENASL